MTRAGLWSTSRHQQLQMPFEGQGLSERIHATGHLQLSGLLHE